MQEVEEHSHTASLQIKNQTEIEHKEVEDLLVPMLSSIKTKEDYIRILKIFYGFFFHVETQIKQYISSSYLSDINERRKSGWIKNDLQALNYEDQIKISSFLPNITNATEAFGALYVLEGSTLGGRMITKMLLKNKDIDLAKSLSFFNGYNNETGPKWKLFLEAMNSYSRENNATNEIIIAAKNTFTNLKKWIEFNEQGK